MKLLQQGMALFLSWCLLLIVVRDGLAFEANPTTSQSPPQAAQQSPEQLEQLVAPIALYPDGLVAQILSAATYPDQVLEAGKWFQQHKKLTTRAGCAVFPLVIFTTSGLAQQPAPQTFSSTIEASQNLLKAVQSNDEPAIEHILGGPTELTSSSDKAQDKVEREMFVQKYQEMHRLSPDGDGSVTLYIGAENWPFPIPLVQRDGAWHFDADAGRKEILFRRIGENELAAIAMCHEFAANEKGYRKDPGAANPAGISPTSLVARAATASTGGDPVLLHGYYLHIVSGNGTGNEAKTTGRFTLIAYPAEYRSSGVMTFIVTEKDVVYEKDLGPTTSTIASGMSAFHKDATWIAAGE